VVSWVTWAHDDGTVEMYVRYIGGYSEVSFCELMYWHS